MPTDTLFKMMVRDSNAIVVHLLCIHGELNVPERLLVRRKDTLSEWVFFPLSLDADGVNWMHAVLVAANMKTESLMFFDSGRHMGAWNLSEQIENRIREAMYYLAKEVYLTRNASSWRYKTIEYVDPTQYAPQHDNYNCAAFVALYAQRLMEGRDLRMSLM
uniref:ULP_PROTEASE domain-containing protein n=1 Tax=Steinernema glaseri TaxID=37863 RepID=A0A1I7Y3C9_9BILA